LTLGRVARGDRGSGSDGLERREASDREVGGFDGRRRSSDFQLARRRLVEGLQKIGVHDRRVLSAFGEVRRHQLIPEALQAHSYRNEPLPIGEGQTISAPGVVAVMTQALELSGSEKVLEIGTGSGYQAAILSRLASQIISIERIPRLAARARTSLDELGVGNVVVYLGDGTRGRAEQAPYDAIIVTAGGPSIPNPLLEQLAPGGRLVGPFGERADQRLVRVRHGEDGRFTREVLGRCRFVDLIGAHGWAVA